MQVIWNQCRVSALDICTFVRGSDKHLNEQGHEHDVLVATVNLPLQLLLPILPLLPLLPLLLLALPLALPLLISQHPPLFTSSPSLVRARSNVCWIDVTLRLCGRLVPLLLRSLQSIAVLAQAGVLNAGADAFQLGPSAHAEAAWHGRRMEGG